VWNERAGSAVLKQAAVHQWNRFLRRQRQECDMTSELQIHTIARQMLEKHGPAAIAQAAQNAIACERKGEAEEAKEWRHVEGAMKIMRGPHQS
jgi:hypothetical protein